MVNRWNPEGELFDRPVPDGMIVDEQGLVDSWVAKAEDWLDAYAGIEVLSSREAFEGIECLGRLARCSRQLVQKVDGLDVLDDLEKKIGGSTIDCFYTNAIEFPNLLEWLEQAKHVWDEELDDSDISNQLLLDLDAADMLSWFGARIGEQSEVFEDQLTQCHEWMRDHALMFIVSEPLVRAIAKTFARDLDITDTTGCLEISTLKFLTLLDSAEEAWEDSIPKSSELFVPKRPALGRLKTDWQVEYLPATAASGQRSAKAKTPIRWHDAESKFEATTYLPDAVAADGTTEIELFFGTGIQFVEPAMSLVGHQVRLGGAEGVIQIRLQGGNPFVFASLRYDEVVSVDTSVIELIVEGLHWI